MCPIRFTVSSIIQLAKKLITINFFRVFNDIIDALMKWNHKIDEWKDKIDESFPILQSLKGKIHIFH